MTDTPETTPAPVDPIVKMKVPGSEAELSYDVTNIPAEARLELLKNAVRGHVMNRVNQVGQRYAKDEKVKAWEAYDNATAADPLQTLVTKPEGDRPAPADYLGAFNRAIAALSKGEIRSRSADGERKERKTIDPLNAAVTNAVVREVFNARKAAGENVTFLAVKAMVGDGIEYLNKMIEEKVAAGVDRAGLEKYREDRYIAPAKIMLGITTNKKTSELPSIL